ncbi:hypothetical protein CNEO4_640026 [Clostridium neonatale]|nr:hypothetical protein CNEO_2460003 [Clostridium neonatale]CAI3677303.1 hypothetical protein CNEO4_640026 [Clostridium neonatale]
MLRRMKRILRKFVKYEFKNFYYKVDEHGHSKVSNSTIYIIHIINL